MPSDSCSISVVAFDDDDAVAGLATVLATEACVGAKFIV